jgi:small subunit ribosomal protein S9
MATKKAKTKKDYIYTVGRRKTATARIRLFEGKKEIEVNGKPISEYWPGKDLETLYMEPFVTTNTHKKYTATVKVEGSGKKAQLGAFIHGISRALVKINPDRFKPILKKKDFITRDPRMKETRKVGSAGSKARSKRQSPKR